MTCNDCGKTLTYDAWAVGPKYPAVWAATVTTAFVLCGADILRRMARLASA